MDAAKLTHWPNGTLFETRGHGRVGVKIDDKRAFAFDTMQIEAISDRKAEDRGTGFHFNQLVQTPYPRGDHKFVGRLDTGELVICSPLPSGEVAYEVVLRTGSVGKVPPTAITVIYDRELAERSRIREEVYMAMRIANEYLKKAGNALELGQDLLER